MTSKLRLSQTSTPKYPSATMGGIRTKTTFLLSRTFSVARLYMWDNCVLQRYRKRRPLQALLSSLFMGVCTCLNPLCAIDWRSRSIACHTCRTGYGVVGFDDACDHRLYKERRGDDQPSSQNVWPAKSGRNEPNIFGESSAMAIGCLMSGLLVEANWCRIPVCRR